MASLMQPVYKRPKQAAVDLSAKQYYYVADNGSNKYNISGGVQGAIGAGFLMNKPAADEFCEVAGNGGGAKGICAATISAADMELKANALGTLEPALEGDIVVALSVQTAAVSDIFEVNPVYYVKGETIISRLAAIDLSSSQYLYVGDDGTGEIDIAGGVRGEVGSGFLANAPTLGLGAIVHGVGFTSATAIAGATIAADEIELKANTLGKLETALVGDIVVAISVAAAVVDDEISVFPMSPYQKDAAAPIALLSAVDLTSGTGLYVGDNGSGAINVVGGIQGGIGYGFLANAPDTGEAALITGPGFQKANAIAGATVAAAKVELKANALGKLETALPGDTVVAISTASAVADDAMSVIPVFYQKDSVPVTFVAAEDLTGAINLYVGDDTGLKKVGGANGASGYGFLENAPDTGESAIISGPGRPFAKCVSGAAFSINDPLIAEAGGKLIVAAAAGGLADNICAIALAAASGADETIPIIPVAYQKNP